MLERHSGIPNVAAHAARLKYRRMCGKCIGDRSEGFDGRTDERKSLVLKRAWCDVSKATPNRNTAAACS
jgi:hypothetical protein